MAMVGVPLKCVIMYHADSQNESIAAEGYEVCDGRTLTSGQQDINPGGSYTLPDLRNRFILGVDLTAATAFAGDNSINGPSGAPGPKGSGGASSVTISIPNLPVHTHAVTDPTHTHSVSDPTHAHAVSDPGHTHTYTNPGSNLGTGSAGGVSGPNVTASTGSALTGIALYNAATGITIVGVGTGISIQNTGSGTAVENRPRYYGLVFMMKVRN